ncbi:MAG: zinc-dependent metalloprotease [Odoribacter splanchnicus]
MWKKIGFILLLSCGTILSAPAQQDIAAYFKSQQTKDSLVKIPGLFQSYRLGDKVYWEIPDTLLGRDLALTTTIVRGAAQKNRNYENRYGFNGDSFGPILLRFQKRGNEIWLVDPLYDRLQISKTHPLYPILSQRGNERLYTTLPIKAKNVGSVLIDVTTMLQRNPLFTFEPFNFEVKVTSSDPNKTIIKNIQSTPQSVITFIDRNYRPMSMDMKSESYAMSWETAVCISLLPQKPHSILAADGRVGYFNIGFQDFERHPYQMTKQMAAKRWRLELSPENREKYNKGELVEPENPIVFFIDRNTPTRWVPYFIEAVNVWQAAFEQAGFKNAIKAQLAPTQEEDPNFSPYDGRHAYISWKPSGESNAYGPSPSDPRSGEISGCHVGVFSSVLDLLQKWYFVQCGVVDKRAREIHVPDEVLGEMLKLVITHEVGHSLGLEHNFLASSHNSIGQLRDNEFLNKYGITSSIMDYVRCNFAIRPEDNVDFKNRIAHIGQYDRLAIEWAYRIFPGETPEEQQKNREIWLTEKQADPRNRFGDGLDFKAQSEDLGNDHVELNTQGVENLKQLMNIREIWQAKDATSRHVLNGRHQAIVSHYNNLVSHVLKHLGGYTNSSKAMQDSMKFFTFENQTYSTKVMSFIQDYVCSPTDWLFNPDIITPLGIDLQNSAHDFYDKITSDLVGRFIPISKAEQSGLKDAYALKKYIAQLHDAIFSEWNDNKDISNLRQILQQCYIEKLCSIIQRSNYVPSQVLVNVLEELERIDKAGVSYIKNNPQGKKKIQIQELTQPIKVYTHEN